MLGFVLIIKFERLPDFTEDVIIRFGKERQSLDKAANENGIFLCKLFLCFGIGIGICLGRRYKIKGIRFFYDRNSGISLRNGLLRDSGRRM